MSKKEKTLIFVVSKLSFSDGGAKEICPPVSLDQETQEKIQRAGEKALLYAPKARLVTKSEVAFSLRMRAMVLAISRHYFFLFFIHAVNFACFWDKDNKQAKKAMWACSAVLFVLVFILSIKGM